MCVFTNLSRITTRRLCLGKWKRLRLCYTWYAGSCLLVLVLLQPAGILYSSNSTKYQPENRDESG